MILIKLKKIETLVFELKNIVNFEGVNFNFPFICAITLSYM
jgi:hypothetical protein